MARASQMVLAYVVIGAVMFGGGAVDADNMGLGTQFVDTYEGGFAPEQGDGSPRGLLIGTVDGAQEFAAMLAGAIVFVSNLLSAIIGYLNWPIMVLIEHNAPPAAIAVIGVPFTASFYMSIFSVIR